MQTRALQKNMHAPTCKETYRRYKYKVFYVTSQNVCSVNFTISGHLCQKNIPVPGFTINKWDSNFLRTIKIIEALVYRVSNFRFFFRFTFVQGFFHLKGLWMRGKKH